MERKALLISLSAAILCLALACDRALPPEPRGEAIQSLSKTATSTETINIAVILVSPDGRPWSDASGNPLDPVACAANIMFGDGTSNHHVAGLFNEMSFGALTITGGVFGPYSVTSPPAEECDVISWHTDAMTAFTNAGNTPGEYQRFMFVFPVGIPCRTDNITEPACAVPGTCYLGGCAPSPNVYVFNMLQASVYAHELGHTFGLSHCSAPNSSGVMTQNMDFTSVMSATGVAANYCGLPSPTDIPIPLRYGNTPQMVDRDWIHTSNVEIITAAGTYTVDLLGVEVGDANSIPPQTLAVRIDYGSSDAVISFRTDQGTFQGNPELTALFADPAFLDAGNINDWNGVSWFHSVDVHAGGLAAPMLVGVLDDGAHNTYNDPNGKYAVTFLSELNNVAHVQIVVNPEDAIAVSPTSITAPADAGLDSGHPYVLTIWNNYDFARTYDVVGVVEGTNGGLSCSVWPVNPVTVPASSSGDVDVYLYFNGAPPDNSSCQFSIRVTQQAAPYQQLTSSWLFRSVVPCVTPPSAPWNLSALAPHQWVDLSWHAAAAVCGSVDYYQVYRVGTGVVGSSATTAFTDMTTQANTLYTYKVRAVDTHGNVSAWSNSYKIRTGDQIVIEGM